ncbi:Protein kinase superfamily protein [Striga hermonthica]|uniref:Protein kinase superfamily protein n=1 Tax=Striga hermonthica TaxID=68872 RepID=A0A9N7MU57_STRHE|nr:Protein kinase superfamily protein [Striga hermonthica]
MATGAVVGQSGYARFFPGRKRAHRSKGAAAAAAAGIHIKKKKAPLPDADYDDDDDDLQSPLKKRRLVSKSSISSYGSIHDYECLNRISQGSYGAVYRARHKTTDEIVAIKKEFGGLCKSTLTEINILRSIRHPSIVEYKHVAVDDCDDGIYVVMEYVEYDLHEYLKRSSFTLPQVKRLMKELLEGVNHLHQNRVMHRDLKPSNVLVDAKGKLKICDFGVSRQFPSALDPPCTPHVGTLWYAAPELFLEPHTYLAAVDMWSVGCIMAEFFLRQVLFKGASEIEQLRIIVTSLEQPHSLLREKFAAASEGGVLLSESGFELLSRLLCYSPKERITAQDALNHEWFCES